MAADKGKPAGAAVRAASVALQRYAPRLHGYLVRRIRRASDVPDLMQEVFERFLRTGNAATVRDPQSYLFRIASHVVADSLTAQEHSIVTYDSEVVEQADRNLEHATADNMAEQLNLARELQRALRALPPMHSAVVLLAIRDGLPHKEVARRTGLSVKTVGLYVCEARARIRMMLEQG